MPRRSRPRSLAAAVLLLACWAPTATPAEAQSTERVADALRERVARESRVLVIVELAESTVPEGWLPREADVRDQRRRVVSRQIDAIYGLAGTDAGEVRPYAVVPFLALEVGPRALAALEASPAVRGVHAARVAAPQLDGTVPIVQGDAAHAIGFDGTGQTVVVLDTGTDGGHQNFPAGKIVDEACFADGATAGGFPQGGGLGDCPGGGDTAFGAGAGVHCNYHGNCFHGTHVAGIAAGVGPQFSGVATGADLIPIQVFSQFPGSQPECGGSPCPLSWQTDQDAALSHVFTTLRFSHDIAAVNMSLGSGAFMTDCDASVPSTTALVDNLRSVGIATVAASGNNSCGGTGCTDAMSEPACISSVVSVSATRDNDSLVGFANRSPLTTFFAPGFLVAAPQYQTAGSYQSSSGTSMAAPHVAGAFAILKHAVPAAAVTTLVDALHDTGKPIQFGVPRINIRDALGDLGFPECDDGIDNDGDGLSDTADPGCADAADPFETNAGVACDDGIDNDGDGDVDTADIGCAGPAGPIEDPACNDGIDNDGDGGIDWDGVPPDSVCVSPSRDFEASSSCGLGPELVLLLPLLLRVRRR